MEKRTEFSDGKSYISFTRDSNMFIIEIGKISTEEYPMIFSASIRDAIDIVIEMSAALKEQGRDDEE